MKIGFACVYELPPDVEAQASSKAESERWVKPYRFQSTTIKWLNENKSIAEDRLYEIMQNNCKAIRNLVRKLSEYPEQLRMLRLGSSICPGATHRTWSWFYDKPDVQKYLSDNLKPVGDLARRLNVKLSFHPGQFTVLASDKPEVVSSSLLEFEHHVDICKYLGFAKKKLDMKVNVHLSGRGGIPEFKRTYSRLSPEARRVITLENDEFGASIDDLLPLYKKIGLVLDIHHHWINSEGEYIRSTDGRLKYIKDSWRGKRPTIHYSNSKEQYTLGLPRNRMFNFDELISMGFPKTKLRAHSMLFGNKRMNSWALSFLPEFDIMCEAKAKNLASGQLYLQAVKQKIITHS